MNENYTVMDWFDYRNFSNGFIDVSEHISMTTKIWERAVGKYTLYEWQHEAPNIPLQRQYSFQDEHCVYAFNRGFGCNPQEITEYQLDVVAREFRKVKSSVSIFQTFQDIYDGAIFNMPRLQINICCNDDNGNFNHQIEQITIDDEIIHMEPGYIDDWVRCEEIEDGLALDYEDRGTEIRCEIIATSVGNCFWNVIEAPLPEAVKLINFLLDCRWCVPIADLDLYNICNSGNRITEQHLEEACSS